MTSENYEIHPFYSVAQYSKGLIERLVEEELED
jgi:hypothetical protein